MKYHLRLFPFFLSLLITSGLLFGGWFVYQSLAIEQPLSQIISELPGVDQAKTTIQKDRVIVELTLSPDAPLREIVQTIRTEGQSLFEHRSLQIEVNNPPSPELENWWSQVLFDIAEAMEHRKYSEIPITLEQHKVNLPNLSVSTEMDDIHVYIRLLYEDQSKFVILPRVSPMMGVWENE